MALLIQEQRHGVSALKFHELKVVVTTTLYPDLNIDHVAKISAEMMELGADGIGLIPYTPEPGAEVGLESPTPAAIAAAAEKAATFLPIVEPLLREEARETGSGSAPAEAPLPRPTSERPNVAVVSSNGIEVDLHLGQAIRLLIYGPREDGLACLLDVRDAPEPGTPRTLAVSWPASCPTASSFLPPVPARPRARPWPRPASKSSSPRAALKEPSTSSTAEAKKDDKK